MARVIFKYALDIKDQQIIQMPADARLLHVGEQFVNGMTGLFLWALVDQDQPLAKRMIAIVGTDNPVFGELGAHVGTALMTYGAVWHVFDQGEYPPE
jgi:hypothetical protein